MSLQWPCALAGRGTFLAGFERIFLARTWRHPCKTSRNLPASQVRRNDGARWTCRHVFGFLGCRDQRRAQLQHWRASGSRVGGDRDQPVRHRWHDQPGLPEKRSLEEITDVASHITKMERMTN